MVNRGGSACSPDSSGARGDDVERRWERTQQWWVLSAAIMDIELLRDGSTPLPCAFGSDVSFFDARSFDLKKKAAPYLYRLTAHKKHARSR